MRIAVVFQREWKRDEGTWGASWRPLQPQPRRQAGQDRRTDRQAHRTVVLCAFVLIIEGPDTLFRVSGYKLGARKGQQDTRRRWE